MIRYIMFVLLLFCAACTTPSQNPAAPLREISSENPILDAVAINVDDVKPHRENFELARQTGARWVRLWLHWRWMEVVQGEIDWTFFDAQVIWAKRNGLQIYAGFDWFPPWSNGGKPCNENAKDFSCANPPTDPKTLQRFVSKAVARYKDDIHYWGLWNEPNLKFYFNGSPNDYIQTMMNPMIDAILKTDPTATIVGPELSLAEDSTNLGADDKNNVNWKAWLTAILSSPKANQLKVVSQHIYKNPPDFEDRMKKIKAVVDSFKIPRPIWITEIGYNTCEVGEDEQSKRYLKILDLRESQAWNRSWTKVFFFTIRDSVENVAVKECRGAVSPAGKPKKIVAALQKRYGRTATQNASANDSDRSKTVRVQFVQSVEKAEKVGVKLNYYQWNYYWDKFLHLRSPDPTFVKWLVPSFEPTTLVSFDEWWTAVADFNRMDSESF